MATHAETHREVNHQPNEPMNDAAQPRRDVETPAGESGLSVLFKIAMLIAVPAAVFALIKTLVG